MKQYIYKSSECGLESWPSGTLRLSHIEVTENPHEADLFTVPGALTALFPNRAALRRLPYFKQYEEKHVAFDCSDNEPLYSTTAMLIRCNTRDWYLTADPNTISWPWPVDDYADCLGVPSDGFKYDVSFHGWTTSHASRKLAFESMSTSQLKCDLAGYSDFTGYIWDTPEGLRRRCEFRRSIRESRIVLAPESIDGVFPYRAWEAMSAGRVSLLVGSNFVFPFAAEIPYEEFMIRVPRELAAGVSAVATEFLRTHSDEQVIAMGQKARYYYETWLHRDKWPELMALAVGKKLAVCA